VIAARSADGEVECYDVTENEHRDHILKIRARRPRYRMRWPRTRAVAEKIANALTMSACSRSSCSSLPETADRMCWSTRLHRGCIIPALTLDGASISQFEQHIRAIAGWPLGKPVRHGEVTMTNLIGDDILDYEHG
jgi:5-(carboxyamino)imidazole ribonucleotide synthase